MPPWPEYNYSAASCRICFVFAVAISPVVEPADVFPELLYRIFSPPGNRSGIHWKGIPHEVIMENGDFIEFFSINCRESGLRPLVRTEGTDGDFMRKEEAGSI